MNFLPPESKGETMDHHNGAARRPFLLWALSASALLAGCGSSPSRTARPAAGRRSATEVATSPRVDTGVVPVNLGLSGELREALYARVMLVVNTPYTYGGNTPEGGFDCSGLIQYAIQGITTRRLPRTTAQWAGVSAEIDRRDLQRGDFLFFNTMGGRYSHMGIYAGNNQFVHAPSSGGVVKTVSLDNPYFSRRFTEARTIFDA